MTSFTVFLELLNPILQSDQKPRSRDHEAVQEAKVLPVLTHSGEEVLGLFAFEKSGASFPLPEQSYSETSEDEARRNFDVSGKRPHGTKSILACEPRPLSKPNDAIPKEKFELHHLL
jgi:hypothetical protein